MHKRGQWFQTQKTVCYKEHAGGWGRYDEGVGGEDGVERRRGQWVGAGRPRGAGRRRPCRLVALVKINAMLDSLPY